MQKSQPIGTRRATLFDDLYVKAFNLIFAVPHDRKINDGDICLKIAHGGAFVCRENETCADALDRLRAETENYLNEGREDY